MRAYEIQISSRRQVSFSVLYGPLELASFIGHGFFPSITKAQTLQAEPRILEWLIFYLCKHQRPVGTARQRGVTHIADYEIGNRSMPTWLPFKLLSKYKVVLSAFTYTASTLRLSPAFRTINTLWLAARFAGTSCT